MDDKNSKYYQARKEVGALNQFTDEEIDDARGRAMERREREAAFLNGMKHKEAIVKPSAYDPELKGGEVLMMHHNSEILAAGELTVLAGQAKSGKTKIAQALIRHFIKGGNNSLFGMRCPWDKGQNFVLYVDFDQNPASHNKNLFNLAKTLENQLTNYSLQLKTFNLKQTTKTAERAQLFGELVGYWRFYAGAGARMFVILDNIGQLITDVNDPAAVEALLTPLQALAFEQNAAILAMLHYNPGQAQKTRGVLGSQLERDCFCQISVHNTEEGVYMKTDLIREGEKFKIDLDYEEGLACYIEMNTERKTELAENKAIKKAENLKLTLIESFKPALSKPLVYSDLLEAIMDQEAISKTTAKRRIKDAKTAGLISKDDFSAKWAYTPN